MLLLSGGRAAGARGLQQLQPGAGHRLLELMAAQLGAGAPYSSSAPNTPGQGFIGSYTPITKQLWETRQAMLGAEQPAAAASARPPKPTSVTYGFTQSRTLTELYRNPWGFCRVGRLLEDIDSVSGTVAFDHCHQPGEPPPLLVTASVDAIDYVRPISLEQDVCMSGQVVWTGRSSLDIRVQLTQGLAHPSLVATLCFVSLDRQTKKGRPVPQLLPQTEEQKDMFEERQRLSDARKAAAKQAAAGGDAPADEAALAVQQQLTQLQQLGAAQRDWPALVDAHTMLIGETTQRNTFVCQPQQRNTAGRVFGGFLMRRAYELAFATAYQFGGARPQFLAVADTSFRHPVDVGDLMRLTAFVVHTQRDGARPDTALVAVDVEARVLNPEGLSTRVTNTFTFTYAVQLGGRPLRRVVPGTAEELQRLQRYLMDA